MLKTIFLILISATSLLANTFPTAQSCGECHEAIVRDWRASRHGNASLDKDALYRHMYNWALEASKGKLKQRCIICHSPLSTVFKNYTPETDFNREGVTCVACHGVESIRGMHSALDLEIDFSTIYSTQPDPANEAHPVAHRDFFEKSDLCLPCHAEMKNNHGVFACDTGNEWQQYFGVGKKHCQDCHTPRKDGTTDHRLPRRPDTKSVHLDLELNDSLEVSLTNIGAGHAIPTGTPLRMLVLKITARDTADKIVWQNWETNAMLEDTAAVFMKILADASGKGPVPPWRATQIRRDRRLWPGQIVTVKYAAPSNATKITASLFYHLAPPPIFKRFGMTDPEFTKPKLLAQKTMSVD